MTDLIQLTDAEIAGVSGGILNQSIYISATQTNSATVIADRHRNQQRGSHRVLVSQRWRGSVTGAGGAGGGGTAAAAGA